MESIKIYKGITPIDTYYEHKHVEWKMSLIFRYENHTQLVTPKI